MVGVGRGAETPAGGSEGCPEGTHVPRSESSWLCLQCLVRSRSFSALRKGAGGGGGVTSPPTSDVPPIPPMSLRYLRCRSDTSDVAPIPPMSLRYRLWCGSVRPSGSKPAAVTTGPYRLQLAVPLVSAAALVRKARPTDPAAAGGRPFSGDFIFRRPGRRGPGPKSSRGNRAATASVPCRSFICPQGANSVEYLA